MLLVVGWDGADLGLIEPWVASGDLPNLAALMQQGCTRPLQSTTPPVTFPAWTSFSTAIDPSWHGITDFTVRDPASGGLRFVNASWRETPTIYSRMQQAGLRVGVFAFPASWPPEKLTAQFCGFDTPLGSADAAAASEPPELASQIVERFGRLPTGGPDQRRIGPGWHEDALQVLLEGVSLRTDVVEAQIREGDLDVVAVHFMESDTAAHHFWQFHDPASPRFSREGPSAGLLEVYRALDASLGRLLAAVGEQASVMLLSDHGSCGASDQVVFWNRWLAERGYLCWERGGGLQGRATTALRALAIAAVPLWLQKVLWKRAGGLVNRLEGQHRLAGIDWAKTRVFSEELNYAPSFWFNLEGREPGGVVSSSQVEDLIAALEADLAGFRHPQTGKPVVSRVRRREQIYSGPLAERLPDLFLELADVDGFQLASGPSRGGSEPSTVRTMSKREASGVKGTFMSGAHSALGLCVIRGSGVGPGTAAVGSIESAGATALGLAGVDCPASPFAAPWAPFSRPDGGASEPLPSPGGSRVNYSEAQEEEVRERLRALGYLR